jgi:hypothetical protein
MGQGRFINQKLGKNVSRKVGLLKSELGMHAKHNPPSKALNLPAKKKELSPAKP